MCLIYDFFYCDFQDSDNCWWDAFATEFFEDDASLTLSFCLEDGAKRYSKCLKNNHFASSDRIFLFWLSTFAAIGRTLIPRYFRSIFEGGVNELYFHLKLAKESFHNTTVTLDCDQCTMVTHHIVKPTFTKVSGDLKKETNASSGKSSQSAAI